MQPRISIIIPCYNLGSYLDGCLLSIQKQSHIDNVEYIFVNDGSTDDTLEKLQIFSSANPYVKVINQSNGGVSSARNKALENANGDYVYLLDGDDMLSDNAITLMLEAIEDNPDIIFSPLQRLRDNQIYNRPLDINNGVYTVDEIISNNTIFPIAPQPIYKRKLLEEFKIRFNPLLSVGEVLDFTFKVMMRANRIKITDKPFFIYVLRTSGSATQQPNVKKDLSIIDSIREYQKTLGERFHHPFFLIPIYKLLMSFTYNKYIRNKLKGEEIYKALTHLRNNINVRKILKEVTRYKLTSRKDKFLAWYFLNTGISGYKFLIKFNLPR